MKRKRTYSRKHKALRWIIRLAVLMLVLHLTGWYCLLPGRAVEKAYLKEGLLNMETVHVEWGEYAPMRGKQLRVVANEDAAILYGVKFHPISGWIVTGIANTLDLHDPEHYLYTWDVTKRDKNQEWIGVFGYVPDGEAAPTFRVGLQDWNGYQEEARDFLAGQYEEMTPIPTISMPGGKLYLEQFGFTMPEDDDIVAMAAVLRDGQWEQSKYRCGTSMG